MTTDPSAVYVRCDALTATMQVAPQVKHTRRRKKSRRSSLGAEEQALSELVFGSSSNPSPGEGDNSSIHDLVHGQDDTFADTAANSQDVKPAWSDDDDNDVQINLARGQDRMRKLRETEEESVVTGAEYSRRLRRRFEETHGTAEWAKLDSERPRRKRKALHHAGSEDSESDSDMDDVATQMLRSTSKVTAGRPTASTSAGKNAGTPLQPGELEVKRANDANQAAPSNAVVQCVQFHNQGQVLLTGGLDKTLRLFNIDGSHNSKVFLCDYCCLCSRSHVLCFQVAKCVSSRHAHSQCLVSQSQTSQRRGYCLWKATIFLRI